MSQEHTRRFQSVQSHGGSATKRRPTAVAAVSLASVFLATEPSLWEGLVARTGGIFLPIAADLLDVARRLFLADCSVKRPAKSWTRDLSVTMPVRQGAAWQRREVQEALLELLRSISDDHWTVEFPPDALYAPAVQTYLNFDEPYRVCLMSEGLDSISGLARQLAADPEMNFLAVTALTQYQVRGRVRKTINQLNSQYGKRVRHVPVPLYRKEHRMRAKEEPSQRVRSFLLLALGAVAALMTGQQNVEIYENGIEMFNLPLAPCLHPELFSRAMHPTVLALMAKFVSTLVDAPFTFTAPFAFQTKGEMVQAIRDTVPVEMIMRTVSCIHFPQRKEGAAQCGLCPGCVLRRTALSFAGILEPANSYQSDFVSGIHANTAASPFAVMWENIHYMDQGVYRLNRGLAGAAPERALLHLSGLDYGQRQEMLQAAASVGGVASQQVLASLVRLYAQYAREWQAIRPTIRALAAPTLPDYSRDQEVCVV
jgi:7-cyano-7-deazaguanine synthase in queuosine biosynthesis